MGKRWSPYARQISTGHPRKGVKTPPPRSRQPNQRETLKRVLSPAILALPNRITRVGRSKQNGRSPYRKYARRPSRPPKISTPRRRAKRFRRSQMIERSIAAAYRDKHAPYRPRIRRSPSTNEAAFQLDTICRAELKCYEGVLRKSKGRTKKYQGPLYIPAPGGGRQAKYEKDKRLKKKLISSYFEVSSKRHSKMPPSRDDWTTIKDLSSERVLSNHYINHPPRVHRPSASAKIKKIKDTTKELAVSKQAEKKEPIGKSQEEEEDGETENKDDEKEDKDSKDKEKNKDKKEDKDKEENRDEEEDKDEKEDKDEHK